MWNRALTSIKIKRVAISAFFDCFVDKELEEKISGRGLIIRLWCWASFEKEDGWTLPYPALIDTGAHTSIIPKRIWSILPVNKLAEHYTKGLVPKPECKLDVGVGEINIILLDSGHSLKIKSVDKKLHRGLPLWLPPPFGVILLRNTPGVTLAW